MVNRLATLVKLSSESSHLRWRFSVNRLAICSVVGVSASCALLAGPPIGDLRPTPEAARVFDFYKHGLTHDNLACWLSLGCLFFFCVLVIVAGCSLSELEERGGASATDSE